MEAPDCDFDETTKAGFVRVRMRIPGIKPGRGGSRPKDGNAVFEGPVYGNDNLSITFKILDKGGLDDRSYQFQVNQLPGAIVPEKNKSGGVEGLGHNVFKEEEQGQVVGVKLQNWQPGDRVVYSTRHTSGQ